MVILLNGFEMIINFVPKVMIFVLSMRNKLIYIYLYTHVYILYSRVRHARLHMYLYYVWLIREYSVQNAFWLSPVSYHTSVYGSSPSWIILSRPFIVVIDSSLLLPIAIVSRRYCRWTGLVVFSSLNTH